MVVLSDFSELVVELAAGTESSCATSKASMNPQNVLIDLRES